MKRNILILLCISLCALSACSKRPPVASGQAPKDFVALTLGEAAQSAHSELAMLAQLRGKGMEILLPPIDPSLNERVSIDWAGPAGEALRQICLGIGYKYREAGTKSAQSLLVVVKGLNRPAHELLEDVAWQVQPQAQVNVDPITKTVTLARAKQ